MDDLRAIKDGLVVMVMRGGVDKHDAREYVSDALATARNAALEEAAKIAELSFAAPEEGNVLHRKIAAAIRALKWAL